MYRYAHCSSRSSPPSRVRGFIPRVDAEGHAGVAVPIFGHEAFVGPLDGCVEDASAEGVALARLLPDATGLV